MQWYRTTKMTRQSLIFSWKYSQSNLALCHTVIHTVYVHVNTVQCKCGYPPCNIRLCCHWWLRSVFIFIFQAVEMAKRRQKVNYLVQVNKTDHIQQCCGAGAESRGAKIKLPHGAGAEITNCGSGSLIFTTDLKKFYRKKSWLLSCWRSFCKLLLLLKSKKVIFKVYRHWWRSAPALVAQCTGTGGAVYRHWWRSV